VASRHIPDLDDELRRRLARRFGSEVESWLDALPPVLTDLGERWQIEFDSLIPRGSTSVVIRCRTANDRPAVLKVCLERRRVLDEAAALRSWRTVHVPAVLAVDEKVGALLIEAIEPGTPLADSAAYPDLESVAALLRSLQAAGTPDSVDPPVAERITHLFESSSKLYEWKPDLVRLIPPELYERGRGLALRLAAEPSARVLLHGDLTPVNILDGGVTRGLVAIDPAPCVGDPAFDAVDLILWRPDDLVTIDSRVDQLAPAIGAETCRLRGWCGAFAGMVALEIAERASDAQPNVAPLVELAHRV
jgi:streptomycin 6-kinase